MLIGFSATINTDMSDNPAETSSQQEIKTSMVTRLRDSLHKMFFSHQMRVDTTPLLDKRMDRRSFLKLSAAVGTAATGSMLRPEVAQGQLAALIPKKNEAIKIDNPLSFPVEQYHFEKNEVRALYEKVIGESGYERFLFAVSEDYPLPESFPEDSAEIPLIDAATLGISAREDVPVAELAAPNLIQLFTAAKIAGFTPYLTSGFRTIEYQEGLFEKNVRTEMQTNGYARKQAEEVASAYSARPRTSEHHLGLAYDVLAYPNQAWDEARLHYNQGLFQWLRDNAHKYGFVLSFPTGKTEYEAKKSAAVKSSEPWHLRYVGKEVAEYFFRCNYLHPDTSASVHTMLIDPYVES